MLALDAQPGDVALRTDVSKSFILVTSPASTLANWAEYLFPAGGITSIAGLTGPTITDTALKTALGLTTAVTALATASDVRTGSDTAKALGVKLTWDSLDYVVLTEASTVAVNFSSGINFVLALTGNRTMGNPTSSGGWKLGQTGIITVVRAGAQTLSFAANWVPYGNKTLPASGLSFKIVYEVASSTSIHYSIIPQIQGVAP